jgi:hypothetical protein
MTTAKRPEGKSMPWWRKATPEQARDTGMAMVLICLLLGYWNKFSHFLPAAIVLLIVTMAWPKLFKPLAVLWFGLSHFLGNIVSRVILTTLFFLLVTPIGLIRRLLGADPLQLKKWKHGRDSVFAVREGPIQGKDLANPY